MSNRINNIDQLYDIYSAISGLYTELNNNNATDIWTKIAGIMHEKSNIFVKILKIKWQFRTLKKLKFYQR